MTDAAPGYLLFCSTGLGDSLFATPTIRFLRQQKPDSRITVVVKEKIRDLFETNTHIDRLISYRNNWLSSWQTRRQIRAGNPYRAVFFFHVGDDVLDLIRGSRYERLHCVQRLKNLPPDAQVYPIDGVNKRQWEDFADMVALECGGHNEDNEFSLPLSPASSEAARNWFRQFDQTRPRIGIQLGGSHLGKCWPPQRYAALVETLLNLYSGQVFVNATPAEEPLWNQFQSALGAASRARCHRLPQTSINGLAALLRELDLFISNDTGPLHVALSQNRPVIALKAHDDRTYPYTLPRETPLRRSLFVRTDVPTSGKDYHLSHRAMECISVEAVLAEAEAVLQRLNFLLSKSCAASPVST